MYEGNENHMAGIPYHLHTQLMQKRNEKEEVTMHILLCVLEEVQITLYLLLKALSHGIRHNFY